MAPTNSRKRAAPGASPAVQNSQMPQSYAAPTQNSEYFRWDQQPENVGYTDSAGNNMNNYAGAGLSQSPLDQPVPAASTQLARRPMNNRQLGPTAQRMQYDNPGDPWGQFGDDSILDSNGTGVMGENDNVGLLEEKAAVAKRESQAKRKQIPPFVQKLSSFLDESKNTELIRWSDRGDSFVVLDEDEFAKTLIPELFKHNNYASFVRQLNMYGFHKRVGLSDNSMKASERKNKSPSEYYNPYFKRGHPNLLWLINKPKGGNSKQRKSKVKNEDGQDGESDEDGRDVEEVSGNNAQNSRALSAIPEAGPLQRRDMAVLQGQLTEIQKQQGAITNAISRLRKDHSELYQKSRAFEDLHNRHENSINAILTFLATVYNRSLDGQGQQNIAQMFAAGIPQNEKQQGSVVDIGDISNQAQEHLGSLSPHRRPQRLLMAPPKAEGRASTASPSAISTPQMPGFENTQHASISATIEELFDSPSDSTHINSDFQPEMSRHAMPQANMMSIIQDSNAQNRPNDGAMQFPEMLSHFENSNGNSPLTSEQRNNMLSLIANTSSAAGTKNALTSPTPTPPLSLEELGYTQKEIDDLMRLQAEQERNINDVKSILGPLSPSGSVPGLDGDNYFNGMDSPIVSNLDLDQYLDTGAFYTGSSPMANSGDYDFNSFGDASGLGVRNYDVGMDGTVDSAIKLESPNMSAVNTPEVSTPDETKNVKLSPSKRQRME
ncbi:heat shock transcription factor [Marssonina coronariae]|uniref:Heat shock transcription factor n=1 Tax=Diplocarpon coronariae TaxID=2795749 RepID=A0A218YTP3_9HELO|nr:heat shock transcription factor [Marssonina coronariae]